MRARMMNSVAYYGHGLLNKSHSVRYGIPPYGY